MICFVVKSENLMKRGLVKQTMLPMVNLWHFSGKFDQDNVTVLWFCKTEIQDRARILVLVREESCELQFPKFTGNFCTVSLNIHLRAVPIFTPLK